MDTESSESAADIGFALDPLSMHEISHSTGLIQIWNVRSGSGALSSSGVAII